MAKRKAPSHVLGMRTAPPPRSRRQVPTRTLYLGAFGTALVVAAALVIVSVAMREGNASSPAPVQTTALTGVAATKALLEGLPQRGNVLGSPKAPVTLVEYADPQCPYCGEWARGALPELVRDYVRTGRLRIEYRGMAFVGPDSSKGLAAAVAAGNEGKFWHLIDLLYANQGEENTGWIDDALLGAIADRVGVNVSRFQAERGSSTVARAVNDSTARARAAGIASTPTFYAGHTGGTLRPVPISSLDAGALRPTLDRLLAA